MRTRVVLLLLGAAGCHGTVGADDGAVTPTTTGPGSPASSGPGTPAVPGNSAAAGLALPALQDPGAFGPSAVRRLTRRELRRTLRDVFGLDFGADIDTFIPIDERTPFDNDYTTQTPSAALVEGLKALAEKVADAALAPPNRARVVGCTPRTADDRACLRELTARVGRRLLRRPLAATELDELGTLGALGAAQNDFYFGAGAVLRVLIQDMELANRFETGVPVAGRNPLLRRLAPFELAARLSFFFWGAAPDDALLDHAAAGRLEDPAQLRDLVTRMVWDPRSLAQVQRVHAMWLGYDELALSLPLGGSLMSETDALVRRVLEEGRRWTELFTFPETYIDPPLATHYGLPRSNAAGWVAYPNDGRRRGLLSHGSFLNYASDAQDTDPVLRGRNVLTRLLCMTIPPPPPGVDPTKPAPGANPAGCKPQRMTMRKAAECSVCHTLMDDIGFGLENHGPTGEWRTTEPGRPDCPIDGVGAVANVGPFKHAAGLGKLLADNGQLPGCFAEHFFRFAVGRPVGMADAGTVKAVADAFSATPDYLQFIATVAQSEAFRHRLLEK